MASKSKQRKPRRSFEVIAAGLACAVMVSAEEVRQWRSTLDFYSDGRRVAQIRNVRAWAEQGLITVMVRNPGPRRLTENDSPSPHSNN